MPLPTLLAHKIPPPVLAVAVALLMISLASQSFAFAWPTWLRLAGAGGLFTLGLAIELVAIITFRRAKTTINPLTPRASSQLVTRGIYQYSRNPMYVGMVCQLLALAFYLAAPVSLLGLPLFVVVLNELQIKPEECVLGKGFGSSYREYQQQVRRWL